MAAFAGSGSHVTSSRVPQHQDVGAEPTALDVVDQAAEHLAAFAEYSDALATSSSA